MMLAERFRRAFAVVVVTVGAMFFASGDADAGEAAISVGEVTPPPAGSGIDAIVLRATATDEIRRIDASRLPSRRKILVSLALTNTVATTSIGCTINAMLRDAETGAMIAIIEAGAHAEGPASPELKKQIAHAAVRSAVRRIPGALGAK
jgi:hypothetical protein